MPATGVIYDTRDNEIFPRAGAFHQMGIKFAQGLPDDGQVQYGAASGNFAWYFQLGPETVFATRMALDLQVGNVPFYDLYSGGPFATSQRTPTAISTW